MRGILYDGLRDSPSPRYVDPNIKSLVISLGHSVLYFTSISQFPQLCIGWMKVQFVHGLAISHITIGIFDVHAIHVVFPGFRGTVASGCVFQKIYYIEWAWVHTRISRLWTHCTSIARRQRDIHRLWFVMEERKHLGACFLNEHADFLSSNFLNFKKRILNGDVMV